MKKARRTLLIVLSALAVLGLLAVAARAQKVVPLASTTKSAVSLAGAVRGDGDPGEISLTFDRASFGADAGTFISNPDYPPSLRLFFDNTVSGGPHAQMLSFFYCDAPHDTGVQLCNVPGHSPEHYKRLRILGGILQKGNKQVIFPEGSNWDISFKATNAIERQGTLAAPVIYTIIK
jgi:hypothetical protein